MPDGTIAGDYSEKDTIKEVPVLQKNTNNSASTMAPSSGGGREDFFYHSYSESDDPFKTCSPNFSILHAKAKEMQRMHEAKQSKTTFLRFILDRV